MISPATQIREFAVTIPAGTAQANPQLTDLAMPPMTVLEIDIRVPPGPRGQMGFALWASGSTVIPEQQGQFVVADDDYITWPLVDQISSGAWQLAGYNTGDYDHTVYVTFRLEPVATDAGSAQITPIPTATLTSGG